MNRTVLDECSFSSLCILCAVCLAIESSMGDQWGFCHLEFIFYNTEYSSVGHC